MLRNSPPGDADIDALKRRATNLRRHMLTMARGQGQGYIGQGLGIADVLAALYFHEMRYDPAMCAGRSAIAFSCRQGITRSRYGQHWQKQVFCRSTNWEATAQTTAGWKCRPWTRRPA